MDYTKIFNRINRRICNLVQRGVAKRIRFSNGVQVIQITANGGDVIDGVEHIENYGFASKPLPGAEVIALALAGDSSHTVIITVGDRRYRLELNEGDTALYDHRGNFFWLTEAAAHVKHKTNIKLEAPNVTVVGKLSVSGKTTLNGGATITGDLKSNGKDVSHLHTHLHGEPSTGTVN